MESLWKDSQTKVYDDNWEIYIYNFHPSKQLNVKLKLINLYMIKTVNIIFNKKSWIYVDVYTF